MRGRENLPTSDAPCVVVANHQSAYDIFVLNAYIGIPFKWVMKSELRRLPLVGKACEAAHFIFVDETRVSSIAQTIEDAKKVLATATLYSSSLREVVPRRDVLPDLRREPS